VKKQTRTALVVEDDAHNLLAISTLLKELEIDFKRNTTGSEVLKQAHIMYPDLDFILLDMDLPEGDPFLIYEALRSDPRLENIPVIAIVDNHLVVSLQSRIEQKHFAGVAAKPLTPQALQNLINTVLNGLDS